MSKQEKIIRVGLLAYGAIGEVFSCESFVGGYSEPCSFWHLMVDVSGGAIFDWGSHFIDQILAIMPGKGTIIAECLFR